MKKIYLLICLFVFSTATFCQQIKELKQEKTSNLYSSNIKSLPNFKKQQVDCSSSNAFYCEDFETVSFPNLPDGMTTVSEENNYFIPMPGSSGVTPGQGIQVYGFYTGNSNDANVSGFLPIEEHGKFAMTNDDACLPANSVPNELNNCDLSSEELRLPTFDFTNQSNLWLLFEYYNDGNYGGGDAYVDISFDQGTTWTAISDNLETANTWQNAAYDLSSYEDSSSVNIRIRWSDDNNWASGFAIDDIEIRTLPDYDVILIQKEHAFPSQYFGRTSYQLVPLAQASGTAYNFLGALKNLGLNTLDSARLNANISSESFTTTSDGINSISLAQDTFICNQVFVPTSAGTYTAEIYGSSDNDVSTAKETVTFNVSEYEYARDQAGNTSEYTGGVSINNDGTEQRGNVFDIYTNAELYAVKLFAHPATTPTAEAKVVISTIDLQTGSPLFLTQTELKKIGANSNQWVNFKFENPISLSAGDVIVATIYAENNGIDTLVLAINGTGNAGESILQDVDGVITNGSAGQWYTTASTPMLRLNFDPNVEGLADASSINDEIKLNFEVFPNPNNGVFNIKLNTKNGENLKLDIQNILGQNVFSKLYHQTSNIKEDIDLSNLEKGIYHVIISNKNTTLETQKIIIQ